MLAIDSVNRITMPEIRQHSWFQKNLPKYLSFSFVGNDRTQTLEEDVLQQVLQKLQIDRQTAIDALRSTESNRITVIYDLILDNKKLNDTNFTHNNDYNTTTSIPISSPSIKIFPEDNNHHQFAYLSISPPVDLRSNESVFDPLSLENEDKSSWLPESLASPASSSFQKNYKRSKRWYLGIHTRLSPRDIMLEVYRSLKVLDFDWKRVNPYSIRCRKLSPDARYIKIAIQLYKVEDERYLLDIRKIDGETFSFLHLCTKMLTELNFSPFSKK